MHAPFLFPFVVGLVLGFDDPFHDLHAREVDKRIAAVDALAKINDPRAEKEFAALCANKEQDWEVLEHIASALGEHGTAASADMLEKLALDGPVWRVRLAAATTLAKIAPSEAAEHLLKHANGAQAIAAFEALAIVLRAHPKGFDPKPIERALSKAKDRSLKAAAARALVAAAGGASRVSALARALEEPSVEVACAALDELLVTPAGDCDAALLTLLTRSELSDLIERRARAALAAAYLAQPKDAAGDKQRLDSLKPLCNAKDGAVSARGARLVASLALAGRCNTYDALAALEASLASSDERARAAGAHALGLLPPIEKDATCGKRAKSLAEGDKSARVRLQGLRALAAHDGVDGEQSVVFLSARLVLEPDALVREELCVLLGKRGNARAVDALGKALLDKEWSVAVCAAVSLGKTETGPAFDVLARTAKDSADWKLRGAAVTGLTRLYLKGAVPVIIAALGDADPSVVTTAHAFLKQLAKEKFAAKPEVWNAWWNKNKEGIRLADPRTLEEERKRWDTNGTNVKQAFSDLDLVVLESRGDHIERVLTAEKIEHRLTQAHKVSESGLGTDALFVANCTGEIEDKDSERLRWFVLTGGHLFGSCWALHETIERVAPGVLRRFETKNEVLDNVPAFAANVGSPYLADVFASGTQPLYTLEGAHLIEVLDPERGEVLIDSPLCADRWGSGDLAAWFACGHGTVLDSVNHFEDQGFERAEQLKTRKDRMAFAVDHLGFGYDALRLTKDDKFWDANAKAAEKVRDLSVFRLVTNFVLRWRAEVAH